MREEGKKDVFLKKYTGRYLKRYLLAILCKKGVKHVLKTILTAIRQILWTVAMRLVKVSVA